MATGKPSKTATKPMSIDAGTGRIVSAQYAAAHPKTTVTMKVPVVKPGKAK